MDVTDGDDPAATGRLSSPGGPGEEGCQKERSSYASSERHLRNSLATSSGSSKAGRTNARALGNVRSRAAFSHTRSSRNGVTSDGDATPTSTRSSHAAYDRSMPMRATFADPS